MKKPAWIVGLVGIALVIAFFGPERIPALIGSISAEALIAWLAITIVARIVLVETTVAPLKTLGHSMSRVDIFWLGWVRTFANQVFPAAGLVAYTETIRRKIRISWSEITALAMPQFVLAAVALSFLGSLATVFSPALPATTRIPLMTAYLSLLAFTSLIARFGYLTVHYLPVVISEKLAGATTAFRKFAQYPSVLLWVTLCHLVAILLRGIRMWVLFNVTGVPLDWNTALIVFAISESSMLIQLTPGGLGIREGAVVAGALLAGLPAEAAAGVAIIDRMLVVILTSALVPFAIVILNKDVESVK